MCNTNVDASTKWYLGDSFIEKFFRKSDLKAFRLEQIISPTAKCQYWINIEPVISNTNTSPVNTGQHVVLSSEMQKVKKVILLGVKTPKYSHLQKNAKKNDIVSRKAKTFA